MDHRAGVKKWYKGFSQSGQGPRRKLVRNWLRTTSNHGRLGPGNDHAPLPPNDRRGTEVQGLFRPVRLGNKQLPALPQTSLFISNHFEPLQFHLGVGIYPCFFCFAILSCSSTVSTPQASVRGLASLLPDDHPYFADLKLRPTNWFRSFNESTEKPDLAGSQLGPDQNGDLGRQRRNRIMLNLIDKSCLRRKRLCQPPAELAMFWMETKAPLALFLPPPLFHRKKPRLKVVLHHFGQADERRLDGALIPNFFRRCYVVAKGDPFRSSSSPLGVKETTVTHPKGPFIA